MERWLFLRAHFYFGAHDTSNLSHKLQMKKEKCANLNRKPKLKLAKFDEDSFINDVTEEQSKIVLRIFRFQNNALCTGILHKIKVKTEAAPHFRV